MKTQRTLWGGLVALMLTVPSACTGTEVGNPPAGPGSDAGPGSPPDAGTDPFDPTSPGPVGVNAGGVSVKPNFGANPNDPHKLEVAVAELDQGVTAVQLTLLETSDAPTSKEVAGVEVLSFDFLADAGDQLRLEAIRGAEVLEPVDFVFNADLSISLVATPYDECLERDHRALGVGTEQSGSMRFRNRCSAALTLAGARIRMAPASFEVTAEPGALEVDAVGSLVLTRVEATPAADILFVDVTGQDGTVRLALAVR